MYLSSFEDGGMKYHANENIEDDTNNGIRLYVVPRRVCFPSKFYPKQPTL